MSPTARVGPERRPPSDALSKRTDRQGDEQGMPQPQGRHERQGAERGEDQTCQRRVEPDELQTKECEHVQLQGTSERFPSRLDRDSVAVSVTCPR